ncbi:MAG: hypothetical protein HYW85_04245 [Deltaproteobacteria bacterium]|nr:hypothetical protein [Deltaproteobacteria bacterium]MBI3018019.1 hypothetical protein [Deltaproteobacteria bacterium]
MTKKMRRLLKKIPDDSGLVETLYSRKAGGSTIAPGGALKGSRRKQKLKKRRGRRPTHYKLVCISLYNHDIQKLEQHVQILKQRGHTKANKSQIIRFAIDKVAVEKMPRVY